MEKNLDSLQSIVVKSNLVATAGEFVPKSQLGLEPNVYEHYDRLYNVPHHNSSYVNLCNQSSGSMSNKLDDALAGSSRTLDLNMPHSSMNESSANSSFKYSSKAGYKKNKFFFPDNIVPSFQKLNQNNSKTTEISESKNKDRKINSSNFEAFVGEKDSVNKYFNISRQKTKYNGFNYSSNYSKNKSYKNDNHFKNFPGTKNISWRRKDEFFEQEQNQEYYPLVKSKQNESVLFYNNEDICKKNNSFKHGCKYKSKDFYHQKTEKKENDRGKINLIKYKHENKPNKKVNNKTNQREHLIDLLTQGILECLVCCELIHQSNSVWSCTNCYHVFHLKCIIKWANSSKSDFGWRCPACQNISVKVPHEYFCFCGKLCNPEWNHHDCPHSCGDVCGKIHKKSCPHKCTLLCHPGPCPQCTATITKHCGCERTTKTIQCCSSEIVTCNNKCGKELNCLVHICTKNCHIEDCEDCKELVPQDCFCGKEHQEVKCTIEAIGMINFSCGNVCQKKLTCGNHFCNLICHEGECPKCEITPELVKFCPCKKTELTLLKTEERKSCNDPIPTCDLICGKNLSCSQHGNTHTCQNKCHEGTCPVCPLETMVKCRCGHVDKMIPCSDLNLRAGDIRCDKRCTKKRNCGKHKCNQLCCTDINHECPLPCNRILQCGLHRCEETCHRGHCKPCLRASFEELSCECGAEIIFPPVPCGTRRPPCERPCTRIHICDHPPTHNCHSANQCPPCTVLTKKYCHGRHELRKAVPCHQESFSCGLPCNKEIECGRHKCILPCHPGACLKEANSCIQPCTVSRPVCGHICGAPCHDGPCPGDTPCKEMVIKPNLCQVRVTCECGNRYTTRACHDNTKEYQRIATAKLATKMADVQAGQSIDLNDVLSASKKLSYKTLECNDECKLIERNRRLAIALQIRNPDLSAKLTPRYSEYLKNWAKKDARFCQMIHDKLTDLVQLSKQSKQKSRSYSFDPMNREKRHFIHEYCEHFGCESVAYDQEPKRNVVATALKDKSWLPSISVVEFIQKENSPRKIPVPVIAKRMPSVSQRGMELLPSKILSHHQSDPFEGSATSNNVSEIDYFDWRPQNI